MSKKRKVPEVSFPKAPDRDPLNKHVVKKTLGRVWVGESIPVSTVAEIQKEVVKELYKNNSEGRIHQTKVIYWSHNWKTYVKKVVQVPDPEDSGAGVSTFNHLDAYYRDPDNQVMFN